MINAIKQKTKYSEVEWFGNVPVDWQVKKLKFVFKYFTGGTPDSGKDKYYSENGLNWITITDLDGKFTSESKNKITELAVQDKNMKIAPAGSLLYSFKLSVGQMAFVSKETYTNEAIFAILPDKDINLDFWYYALQSYLIENANENIYGAKIFNQQLIDNSILLVPPPFTQKGIGKYLDIKTKQIKNFISDKKKLISLLEEQKNTIIHNVITKGLEKNVKTKFSGIEWIGEMPENWESRKVTRIFENIGSGTTPNTSKREYYDNGDIRWVNTGDLNDGILEDCEKRITKLAISENPTLRTYPVNSLIIALYGATIGKLSILNFEATVNQACCVMSDTKIADIKFIYYWFLVNKKNLIQMGYGGGQPNISQDIIRSLKIPMPKLEIQKTISKFLDAELKKNDQTIAIIQQEIELMEEFKKSLIYQAVTGKIEALLTNN